MENGTGLLEVLHQISTFVINSDDDPVCNDRMYERRLPSSQFVIAPRVFFWHQTACDNEHRLKCNDPVK
jgi:hypothetical protein